jgi:hypothetical protein
LATAKLISVRNDCAAIGPNSLPLPRAEEISAARICHNARPRSPVAHTGKGNISGTRGSVYQGRIFISIAVATSGLAGKFYES